MYRLSRSTESNISCVPKRFILYQLCLACDVPSKKINGIHGSGSVNDNHCAVAVADLDLSKSSNNARFTCGKFLSLPTNARPITSFEPTPTTTNKRICRQHKKHPRVLFE